jgi:ankyrin repeat protein
VIKAKFSNILRLRYLFYCCFSFLIPFRPIHEAARGGHTAILKFLIDRGVDVNARPNGTGGTPLYYAKEKRGPDHESVKLLQTYGALEIRPFNNV